MVKSPQVADLIIARNADNSSPYAIPFDFSTTGYVQVEWGTRQYTTVWTPLVENIDYTITISLGQGSLTLIDPDSLTDFNFLRIRRIRPAAQPNAYPNAYSGPRIEGEADNTMEVIQQLDSAVKLLEDRPPLDIVPPNAEVGRFTLINSLNPNTLSGSSLKEGGGTITCDINFTVDGETVLNRSLIVGNNLNVGVDAAVGRDLGVGGNVACETIQVFVYARVDGDMQVGGDLTVTQSIAAGGNISSNENFIVGNNLTVGANATIGNNLGVTGSINANDNLTVTKDTVTGTLTVVGASNLNTIFANSAVINAIETNNLIADSATITNLEATSAISGSIDTNTLTVNTSFTIPTACVFNVDGGSFGWFLNPTTNNRTNLVLGIHNNKVVITNEEFPTAPSITVDPNYIPKGGPNGELINSSITDDGTTVGMPVLAVSTVLELADDAVMQVNNAEFGFNIDATDTTKTNLVLGLDNGKLVITNDVMPTGGGGTGDIIVPLNTIAKGGLNNALRASNITDDGTAVTIGVSTEIGGSLSCNSLNTSSIADDGTQVAISKPLSITGNATATGSMIAPNVDVTTFLNMGYTSQMVTNGAVFLFDFVGDFETKPYVQFVRGTEGQLKLTNAALPAVDVSTKYDSSGILSGFRATYGVDTLTISEGTCVVWDGTAYEEVTTSAPIVLNPPLDVPSYVLLRWNGAGSVEAYTQTSRPSNALKVHDAWLYYVTVFNNTIDEVSNHFRSLIISET